MKKFLLIPFLIFFIGCAGKDGAVDQNLTKAKNALLDKCNQDKLVCEGKCKIDYPNADWKYKACISKCYTVYGACKTGKVLKKGYEKTKEFIEKQVQ